MKNKLRILHISDTHQKHYNLEIPDNIQVVIHSGDASNSRDPYINSNEMLDFMEWYKNFPADKKIFVPGNHDTSIERGLITRKDFEDAGIIFLNHESYDLDGIKIFGSPYTPSFGKGWAYNVARHKLYNYWEDIPENTEILITHGPPKHILDNDLDQLLGCKSLYNKAKQLPNLKIHQFGHIHNRVRRDEIYINRGSYIDPKTQTKFINASCVCLDYKWQYGNIITEFTY